MPAANFNLRNINPKIMLLLKKEAAQQNISVNSLILQIIQREFGIISPLKKSTFHDLDYLAGTWNKEDQKTFESNIKTFEKIDEQLWS